MRIIQLIFQGSRLERGKSEAMCNRIMRILEKVGQCLRWDLNKTLIRHADRFEFRRKYIWYAMLNVPLTQGRIDRIPISIPLQGFSN